MVIPCKKVYNQNNGPGGASNAHRSLTEAPEPTGDRLVISIPQDLATSLAIQLVPYLEPVDSGCILSTSCINPVTGYSAIRRRIDGKLVHFYAHRVMYTHMVGPIPEGLTIDHLCKVHNCVNPKHLEAVTQRENVLRSNNMAAINARKTLCMRGHELTTIAPNKRRCDTCAKARPPRKHSTAVIGAGDARHGTWNGYSNGNCRCDECRAASHAYYVSRRDAVAA